MLRDFLDIFGSGDASARLWGFEQACVVFSIDILRFPSLAHLRLALAFFSDNEQPQRSSGQRLRIQSHASIGRAHILLNQLHWRRRGRFSEDVSAYGIGIEAAIPSSDWAGFGGEICKGCEHYSIDLGGRMGSE